MYHGCYHQESESFNSDKLETAVTSSHIFGHMSGLEGGCSDRLPQDLVTQAGTSSMCMHNSAGTLLDGFYFQMDAPAQCLLFRLHGLGRF